MCVVKMSVGEQPCYTLINLPTDSEPPNEMQLKQDLGESLCCIQFANWVIDYLICVLFEGATNNNNKAHFIAVVRGNPVLWWLNFKFSTKDVNEVW